MWNPEFFSMNFLFDYIAVRYGLSIEENEKREVFFYRDKLSDIKDLLQLSEDENIGSPLDFSSPLYYNPKRIDNSISLCLS